MKRFKFTLVYKAFGANINLPVTFEYSGWRYPSKRTPRKEILSIISYDTSDIDIATIELDNSFTYGLKGDVINQLYSNYSEWQEV